jgi:hypothetical protein
LLPAVVRETKPGAAAVQRHHSDFAATFGEVPPKKCAGSSASAVASRLVAVARTPAVSVAAAEK